MIASNSTCVGWVWSAMAKHVGMNLVSLGLVWPH